MPPGSPGKYFSARIRGLDVAAVGSVPEEPRPSRPGTRTSGSTAPTRPRRRSPAAGGRMLVEPFDVMDAGRMGVFSDPEFSVFCVWQARAPGRAHRQRGGLAELQRPEHP